jgi:hypothetical protein
MVQIEEFNLKVRRIPKSQLAQEWKTLSRKPFPKVAAFKLTDVDFERVLLRRSCVEDEQREILEGDACFLLMARMPAFLTRRKTPKWTLLFLCGKTPIILLRKLSAMNLPTLQTETFNLPVNDRLSKQL